jgi:hypothetical protein
MATISGCRYHKVNLKAKIYIYVNSTTQRCPNKIIKIFLLEGFFHLPPVSLTPVANLELRISLRIFEKIRNGPNGTVKRGKIGHLLTFKSKLKILRRIFCGFFRQKSLYELWDHCLQSLNHWFCHQGYHFF